MLAQCSRIMRQISLIHFIERALNLKSGELRRGLPLFAYLFLIMSSYVTGRVVRDSLFLSRFPAVHLPYVDIATAFAVIVVVAVYIRLARGRSMGWDFRSACDHASWINFLSLFVSE